MICDKSRHVVQVLPSPCRPIALGPFKPIQAARVLDITVKLLPARSHEPAVEALLSQAGVHIIVQCTYPLLQVTFAFDRWGIPPAM